MLGLLVTTQNNASSTINTPIQISGSYRGDLHKTTTWRLKNSSWTCSICVRHPYDSHQKPAALLVARIGLTYHLEAFRRHPPAIRDSQEEEKYVYGWCWCRSLFCFRPLDFLCFLCLLLFHAPIEFSSHWTRAPIKLILLSKNCCDERPPIVANTLALNVTFHHLSWFNLIPSGGEKLILEPFPSTPRQKQFGVQSTSSEQKEENEAGDIVTSNRVHVDRRVNSKNWLYRRPEARRL